MASPPTVEIEPLLEPISGDNPSGVPLSYAPEYDQIREARRSDEDLNQGDWQRELKVADWELVVDLCTRCLASKTKDLQIGAWMTEALLHLHGFAGLRDGLVLLLGIQSRFWETYYPEIEDGDLESRLGPFLFLNDPVRGLPFLVRNLAVTRGLENQNFSFLQYRESRDTDNQIKKDPSSESELLDSGRITGKMFDDAVAQTPKSFYSRLLSDVKEAKAALDAFDQDTDAHFGRDAPSLLEVVKAFDDCIRLLDPIYAAKLKSEPDPRPDVVSATGTSETSATTSPSATDGSFAFDGVVVPRRRSRLGTPQEGESPDFGRLLIDFRDRARALSEAGARLTENRERYSELLAEMERLDDEYEGLSAVVGQNLEAYQLVARLLQVQDAPPPIEATEEARAEDEPPAEY